MSCDAAIKFGAFMMFGLTLFVTVFGVAGGSKVNAKLSAESFGRQTHKGDSCD